MSKALAFYRCLGLDIPQGQEKSPHVEFNGPDGYNIGFVNQAMVKQTDPKWTEGFGHRINLQFAFVKPAD